jgi:hypothetical protein
MHIPSPWPFSAIATTLLFSLVVLLALILTLCQRRLSGIVRDHGKCFGHLH